MYSKVYWQTRALRLNMMTSSNGNIFRVTGLLCGESGEFPSQWPVTRSFDVFFGLRLDKRLSKQPRGWWFETPSRSLSRQCNEIIPLMFFSCVQLWQLSLYERRAVCPPGLGPSVCVSTKLLRTTLWKGWGIDALMTLACISLNKRSYISKNTSLKFEVKGSISNTSALVPVMAWRWTAPSHCLNQWCSNSLTRV